MQTTELFGTMKFHFSHSIFQNNILKRWEMFQKQKVIN